MSLHERFDLCINDRFESSHGGERRPCTRMDVLVLRDWCLTYTVHGVLPACETAQIVAQLEGPVAQGAAVALSQI
jgi:hypothetical protein